MSSALGAGEENSDETKAMETEEVDREQEGDWVESDDSHDTIELNPEIQVIMSEFSVGVEEAEDIWER